MSKRTIQKKTSPGKTGNRRKELEWIYSEANEQKLEKLRNGLIFTWLACCFAAAYFLTEQQAMVIWAGGAGVALVLGYQVWAMWLEKVVEDRIDQELGTDRED